MAERHLPKTKLWAEGDGFVIVLECVCGNAVNYPGHPDDVERVVCERCGTVWTIEPTSGGGI